jgi:membrane associated rhomboid family serine protease
LDKDLKQFLKELYLPFLLCAIIVGVHLVVVITNRDLGYYGIYPRSIEGLRGIILAPFLHSGWQHLFSNIVPMFVLSSMLVYFYKKASRAVLLMIWLLTGLLVWLFGRENTFHIGASGVVYGLIAFVFSSGLFRGNARSIILSLLMLIMYSGYFEGLAPKEGISWESHLYGAFAGLVMAFVFKNVKEVGEEEELPDEAPTVKRPFFASDTFQITKAERARIEEEKRIAYLLEQQRIALELEALRKSQMGDNIN